MQFLYVEQLWVNEFVNINWVVINEDMYRVLLEYSVNIPMMVQICATKITLLETDRY